MSNATRRVSSLLAALLASLIVTLIYGFPSIFPTGTTIYNPDKAWNGYTIHDAPDGHGSILIDMNGNVVKQWTEIAAVPGPFRILPGGFIMGGDSRRYPYQEAVEFLQLDFDGNRVWSYAGAEQVETEAGETVWSSRQHHDWQREGNPVGYYAPGMEPLTDRGRTLVLAHKNVTVPEISPRRLEDDYIYELNWEGEVIWEWLASDHVDELGFSEEARNAIHRAVPWDESRQSADWLHINSATWLGPNQWYEQGDERFHPENIMFSAREANIIGIIDRAGSIVWRIGPDYTESAALAELGQIIGQHNPHIIPRGLPGEGNVLVFDNGGSGGYGFANPAAPDGVNSLRRDYSRVLEFNPITLELVWEYSIGATEKFQFFSHYVSNAQRLPNGNTLVNEGSHGRLFELTVDKEIVWEYLSPFISTREPISRRIFRAYRVPYDWVPQLQRPQESPVIPPDIRTFRVPAQ